HVLDNIRGRFRTVDACRAYKATPYTACRMVGAQAESRSLWCIINLIGAQRGSERWLTLLPNKYR
ncbi:MAG TPA: hypothetical protein PKD90_08115, partial [Phnomibacter sp.]|nr:hypothetical protein [Phnomibacter sp.]